MGDKQIWELREDWAEMEARQCEKNAAELDKGVAGWMIHPNGDALYRASICAIKAETWREIARNLRQPRNCRVELEIDRPTTGDKA